MRARLKEVGLEQVITVVRNRGYGITAALAGGGRLAEEGAEGGAKG